MDRIVKDVVGMSTSGGLGKVTVAVRRASTSRPVLAAALATAMSSQLWVPALGAQASPTPTTVASTTTSPSTTPTTSPGTTPSTPTTVKVRRAAPKALPPVTIPASTDLPETNGRDSMGIIIGISDALADVPVTSPEYDRLAAERDGLSEQLMTTNRDIAATAAKAIDLSTLHDALIGLTTRTSARHAKLQENRSALVTSIKAAAIQEFVTDSSSDLYPDPNETIEERIAESHSRTIASQGIVHTIAAKKTLDSSLAKVDKSMSSLESDLNENVTATERNTAAHDDAVSHAAELTTKLIDAESQVRLARANSLVDDSDLPLVALDAYWRAAERMRVARPSCGIEWWALAGIGRTESNHGRFSGGEVQLGGDATVPIFGISLNGSNGTQAIGDTDGGAIDGDPSIDRAVGIMQFIPSTWRRYAGDGSGDANADPQNMYDAALAAANYLCAFGPGLDQAQGLRRAYFGYNHSDSYVELVLSRAIVYRALQVPGAPTSPLEPINVASPTSDAPGPAGGTDG